MSSRKAALAACFFLSGATGLVYEVLWSRHLQVLFGSTTESVSVVLATFMTGLGLGAWALGARADRARSPLAIYGWLEIGVGLFALVTGPLLGAAASLYDRLASDVSSLSAKGTLLKIALSAAVLLPPAFLMGGTLPALVKGISRTTDEARRVIGLLYGLNTLGAVAGTMTTGFVLLERLGLTWTMRGTAAVNIALGAAVLVLARRAEAEEPAAEEPHAAAERGSFARIASTAEGRYALFGLFISGATTMAYEIVFTRVLGLVFGVSTYAFTLILAVFLAGLALGAVLQGSLARRFRAHVLWFASAQAGVALLGAIAAAAVPSASRWVMTLRQTRAPSFAATLLLKAGIATALVLPLALVAGIAVPALLAALADDRRSLGSVVGDAYLVNTAGTMAGSLLAGFVLVPLLGTQGTLRAAGAISAATALAAFLVLRERRRLGVLAFAGAAGLVVAAALPAWPASIFLVGDTGRFPRAETRADVERTVRAASHEVLMLREGREATVAAVRTSGGRSLMVSGHPDASDALDMSTQVFLGVIPLAAHPHPADALVIGYGSGVTAAMVARPDEVRRVDVVELEREVLDASPFFHHVNGAVESNPKVRLVVDDARSYVRATRRRYDVIVSEPSNPWRAGVANVFTQDFFRSAERVLAAEGIFAQWVQLYMIDEELLKLVFRTFGSVFPEVQLWWLDGGNVVLLGSRQPIRLNVARVEALLSGPFAKERVRWGRLSTGQELFGRILLGTPELRAFAGTGPLHTDDVPRLEFAAPRGALGAYGEIAGRLVSEKLARGVFRAPSAGPPPDEQSARLGIAEMLRTIGDLPAAIAMLRSGDPEAASPRVLVRGAEIGLEGGKVAGAEALLAEATRKLDGAPPDVRRAAAYLRAKIAAARGRADEAIAAYAETGELDAGAGLETLDLLVDAARDADALALASKLLASARLEGPIDASAVLRIENALRRLGRYGPKQAAGAAAVLESAKLGDFSACMRLETLALLHGAAGHMPEALRAAAEYEELGGFDTGVMKTRAQALRVLGHAADAARLEARAEALERPLNR